MFDSAVREARQRHWYEQGGVPDTLDGRFAMLATVCALLTVRLEASGEDSAGHSAAFVERFVDAMDAEHRQMGISDPALGRTVRTLVAALARRVGEWRSVLAGDGNWEAAVRSSVYAAPATSAELAHSSSRLRAYWRRLAATTDDELAEGIIG